MLKVSFVVHTQNMSAATAIIHKCEALRARWVALIGRGGDEPLQQLGQSVVRLTHVLCELKFGSQESIGSNSAQAAPTHEEVMGAICDLQQHMQAAAAELSRMQKLGTEVTDAMSELASLMQQQQLELDELRQELDNLKFLAQFRDYISQFRVLLARRMSVAYPEIGNSWDQLAFFLQQEREQLPTEREVTQEAALQLQEMGFTWPEWEQLREVADMAMSLMYTGKLANTDAALSQLEGRPMPQGLQHTKSTLKKALQFIKSARVVPRHA